MSSTEYLGCNIEMFEKHIGKQFTEGISWENYGEWHIDHKAPLKYNKPSLEKVAQWLHYTNTQPMWQVKICRKAVDIFLAKPTLNKNDKLYKKNPYSYIHRSDSVRKDTLCFSAAWKLLQ